MNKHKTKLFKKVFQNNSDCYADTWIESEDGTWKEGKVIQAITEETFIPLMGEMWSKAKDKYFTKRKDETLEFAEWSNENYHLRDITKKQWSRSLFDEENEWISTEVLYEIWKKEK